MSLNLDYSSVPTSFSDPLILTGNDSLYSGGSAPSQDASSVPGFLQGLTSTALNTYAGYTAIANASKNPALPAVEQGNPDNQSGPPPVQSSGITSGTLIVVGALFAVAIGAALLLRK